MRTRLPTRNVTGCHDCPFAIEAYDFTPDDSSIRCCFTVNYFASEFETSDDVLDYFQSKTIPVWCPGLKYDKTVEFPNG